jgi:hypothetical protein
VEKVCAPTQGSWSDLAALGCGPPVLLGLFTVPVWPDMLGVRLVDVAGCVALLAWAAVLLAVAAFPLGSLRKRLLLGRHGIALWMPGQSHIVRWDDLGTVWHRVPAPLAEGQPLTVVLEHTSGTRLEITPAFTDHHQVALRVLEELERRAGTRDSSPPQRRTTSDAITPAERGVIEPGETA